MHSEQRRSSAAACCAAAVCVALLPGQMARAATRGGPAPAHAAPPPAMTTTSVALRYGDDKVVMPLRREASLAGARIAARQGNGDALPALPAAAFPRPPELLAGMSLRAWLMWAVLMLAVSAVALLAALFALRRRGRQLTRATRRLRVCMAFDAALFEGMPDPVYLCDGSARLIGCNTAYERFLGICRDQLLGKTLNQADARTSAIPAEVAMAIRQEDQRMLASRRPIRCGHSWRSGDREIRVRHWSRPLIAADGGVAGMMGGFVDISPAADCADAGIAQPSALAMAGHEIRTPLQALIGILDMLLRQHGLRGGVRRQLATAHGAARALLGLVDDMLAMARTGERGPAIRPEAVHVGSLLWEAVRMYRPMATDKGLRLNAHAAPMPHRHLADPARLRQILANLIGNAIKFSAQGEISIALEHCGETAQGDRLRLTVRDQGMGIDRTELPRLFEPFFRAATARGIPGTGLGLPMARQLARQMGGDLDVDSEPGVGTVATLSLVLPRHAGPCQRARRHAARRPAQRAVRLRVMVIDDHDVCRLLLARQLRYLGHEAIFASDGAQALALAQSRREELDALVIDCNMPVVDGFEAVRRWRALERRHHWPRKPVIGYTADPSPENEASARQAGMDACLVKPVDIEQLGRLLLRLASGRACHAPCATPVDLGVAPARGRDRLRELLQSTNAADLRSLQEAVRNADWHAFGSALHRIKGAARMAACERVARCCHALELALRRHDTAALANGVAQLSRALRAWTDVPRETGAANATSRR